MNKRGATAGNLNVSRAKRAASPRLLIGLVSLASEHFREVRDGARRRREESQVGFDRLRWWVRSDGGPWRLTFPVVQSAFCTTTTTTG